MAHIYMTFDFGTDEEKAQLARHKLDGWKQAFRLDKKLLYKFERASDGATDGAKPQDAALSKKEEAKPAKAAKVGKAAKGGAAKGKAKPELEKEEKAATPAGPVKLHLRLAFPGHEKMTEDRLLKRIASEDPFKEVVPQTVKPNDAAFSEIEGRFESLE
jgi:hypothetical protein